MFHLHRLLVFCGLLCAFGLTPVVCRYGQGFWRGRFHCKPTFVFSLKNTLVEPTFFLSYNITLRGYDTPLIRYMEGACDTQATFTNFSMTYYPNLGVFITAFNGVSQVGGETFWELIDYSTGEQFNVGASTYIPQAGDQVAFNLTTISGSHV